MISVLIPVYNYNVLPLVENVKAQCDACGIIYEIIVLDDASKNTAFITQNDPINDLDNCRYEVLPANIGRSAIRNLLGQKAQYNWMLFLDADVLPVDGILIQKYLPFLTNNIKVVYGGIRYQPEKPAQSQILRWHYGNAREALQVDSRKENPYLSLLTLNFCIHKQIFETVRFNETIPNLRHEDTLFSYNLKQHNITIEHIDNPVYHLGLESSEIFLQKSEEAIIGLHYLINNNLISPEYLKISGYYNTIKRTGLLPLARVWHKVTAKALRNYFLRPNPSLFIFDLYRLGYLCSLK